MADKKKKKPKHTSLVLPGDAKKVDPVAPPAAQTDRLGRVNAPDGTVSGAQGQAAQAQDSTPTAPPQHPHSTPAAPPQHPHSTSGAEDKKPKKGFKWPFGKKDTPATLSAPGATPPEDDDLPENAIRMPTRKKPRLSPARRRRRRRRIQAMVLAAVVLAGILVYTSGAYMNIATLAGDATENLRIMARPGDGFPMELAAPGYLKAASMGSNGFAVLTEREMAMVSASGAALWRLTHGYISPGLSAGDTRAVIYARGGREYRVESRTRTLAERTTSQDLLFCEMSPGGWLLVVTTSRYRANVAVYGPAYNTDAPLMEWTRVDEKPVAAAFHTDNRSLVLACLSPSGGALGTTLYLLRTDRDSVQASVREEDARLLRVEYTASNKITAIYDRFTVVYDGRGQELARYTYGGRTLLAADIHSNMVALVFGAGIGETLHTVLLNSALEPQCEVAAEGSGPPQVLATQNGVFLLAGQQVLAYIRQGAAGSTLELTAKPLGLVHGGQPLAIVNGQVLPLEGLLQNNSSSGISSTGSGAAQGSDTLPALPPTSVPDEDETGSSIVTSEVPEDEILG